MPQDFNKKTGLPAMLPQTSGPHFLQAFLYWGMTQFSHAEAKGIHSFLFQFFIKKNPYILALNIMTASSQKGKWSLNATKTGTTIS